LEEVISYVPGLTSAYYWVTGSPLALHHPASLPNFPFLTQRPDTFWASRVLGPKNFRQNNFHARKFLRKFFLSAKNYGQKNFKAEKNPAKKFLSAKILRLDRLE